MSLARPRNSCAVRSAFNRRDLHLAKNTHGTLFATLCRRQEDVTMTRKIAILGASGYTGAELVRLIATHPDFQIVALTGERKAGQPMAAVFPFLRHLDLPDLCRIEDVDFAQVDLAFFALPHATSQ